MQDVTSELMYELLKKMPGELTMVREGVAEVKVEINNLRGTMVSMHNDIHNMYGILSRHDDRLERIERRLDLRDLAETQAGYSPDA